MSWEILFFLVWRIIFEVLVLILLLMFSRNHQRRHLIIPFFMGQGCFTVTNSIALFAKVYSNFLLLLNSVLILCVFLETCQFHLGHLSFDIQLFTPSSYNSLYFFKITSNVLCFVPNFSNLRHLLIFLCHSS